MMTLFLAFGTIAPLAILLVDDSVSAYTPLVLCLGAQLLTLAIYEWRRVGHPLTPAGIVGLGGFLVAALRPVTIQSSGFTTAGALLDAQSFEGVIREAALRSVIQWLLFVTVLGAAYFYFVTRPANESRRQGGAAVDENVNRAGTFLAASLAIAMLTAAMLIQSSGGLSAHFSGVSVRSSFLAGRYYLTLGYVPLAVALTLYVSTRRRHPALPTWTPFGLIAAVALLFAAFVTGGRGPLLLGAIVPLVLLKQLGPKPIRTARMILLGLGLVVGAMIMSLTLRENSYDDGASLAALEENPVSTLASRLTSGAETRPFDSLVLLNQNDLQGDMPHLWGSSYPKLFTYFVPSSILPSKDGGANAYFTERYLPRFFYPDRIETSISAIGEAYLNFGWFGIPVAGLLVGLAAAKFTRRDHDLTLFGTTLYVALTPLFFSFVRGDSYQSVSLALFMVLIAAVGARYIQGAGSRRRVVKAGSSVGVSSAKV